MSSSCYRWRDNYPWKLSPAWLWWDDRPPYLPCVYHVTAWPPYGWHMARSCGRASCHISIGHIVAVWDKLLPWIRSPSIFKTFWYFLAEVSMILTQSVESVSSYSSHRVANMLQYCPSVWLITAAYSGLPVQTETSSIRSPLISTHVVWRKLHSYLQNVDFSEHCS